ncbi:HNH endonuclease, partial [bacterium]|nr:HNH endonuclease [bacterium]
GSYDLSTVEYWQAVKNFEEWSKLPIRPCDEFIHTINNTIRLPSVVVCSKYRKIKFHQIQFPSKRNIYKRDNFTCGYTGKKLSRGELSIDHIIPRSKGGENTWENLVTCEKTVNTKKGDKLLSECGLKLLIKPSRPQNGFVFDSYREEWNCFVSNI